jgi:hypothetical protein
MELGLVPSYSPEYAVAYHGVDGIPLDLDGAARDTAKLHVVAWKGLFDGYLQQHRGARDRPAICSGNRLPTVS